MSNTDKSAALAKISTINAVEGFDPAPLAVEYTDMNTQESRLRLPVMAQVAWFRLKYPEGRYAISVKSENGCFVATARVYTHYNLPSEQYLSEATASRAYDPKKPTVSPREWAQTAALGIALRNAGFGLQFHTAGDSFDDSAVNELGQLAETPQEPGFTSEATAPTEPSEYGETDSFSQTGAETAAQAAEDPFEAAKKMPCPITKYIGKTLGDLITLEPKALVWVATKFTGNPDISAAAKLICEAAAVPA
jgi:hypothetical protein